MKKWFIIILVIVLSVAFFFSYKVKLVERILISFNQSPNGKNWQNEVEKQKTMYSNRKDIIFIGDSHIEQCEWQEIFPSLKVGNRGIGGETSGALLTRLESAVLPGTSVVVVQIGVNDIFSGLEPEEVSENYKLIIEYFKKNSVKMVVTLPFISRYYPEKNKKISELNATLSAIFQKEGISYIDMNGTFSPGGTLLLEFSSDGVHLNSKGYVAWIEKLKEKLGD